MTILRSFSLLCALSCLSDHGIQGHRVSMKMLQLTSNVKQRQGANDEGYADEVSAFGGDYIAAAVVQATNEATNQDVENISAEVAVVEKDEFTDAALQNQDFEPNGILLKTGCMRSQVVLRVAGCFLPASVIPPASMMQRPPKDGANLTEQSYFGIPLSSEEGILIFSGVVMGIVILIVCLIRFWAAIAASSGKPSVEGDDDGFSANVGAAVGMMIPMFFGGVLFMSIYVTNVIVLGHRGDPVDLAALSLVQSMNNCCASCPCEGILQVMEPLVSQAFGIGNHRLCTQYLQRCRFFTFGVFVVVLPVFSCSERIFLYLGQEASVAAKTTLPAMVYWFTTLILRNSATTFFFLRGLGDVSTVWIFVVSNIVHVSAAIIFAVVLDMGIDGIAIAMALQTSVAYMLMHRHLAFVSLVKNQPLVDLMFFTTEALQDLSSYAELAIPSVLVLSCETFYWEINTIIIGWLGAIILAANSSTESLNEFVFLVGVTTSGSAASLVSRALGAGYVRQARFLILLGIVFRLVLWSACSIPLFVFSRGVARVYSTDPEVVAIMVPLLHLCGLTGFFKSSQCVAAALLRAMTKHKIVAFTQFVVYFVIALPLGYYLAFSRGLGIVGVFNGYLVGSTIGAIVLFSIASTVDCDEVTQEIQARLEKDAAETQELKAALETLDGSAGGTPCGSIGGVDAAETQELKAALEALDGSAGGTPCGSIGGGDAAEALELKAALEALDGSAGGTPCGSIGGGDAAEAQELKAALEALDGSAGGTPCGSIGGGAAS